MSIASLSNMPQEILIGILGSLPYSGKYKSVCKLFNRLMNSTNYYKIQLSQFRISTWGMADDLIKIKFSELYNLTFHPSKLFSKNTKKIRFSSTALFTEVPLKMKVMEESVVVVTKNRDNTKTVFGSSGVFFYCSMKQQFLDKKQKQSVLLDEAVKVSQEEFKIINKVVLLGSDSKNCFSIFLKPKKELNTLSLGFQKLKLVLTNKGNEIKSLSFTQIVMKRLNDKETRFFILNPKKKSEGKTCSRIIKIIFKNDLEKNTITGNLEIFKEIELDTEEEIMCGKFRRGKDEILLGTSKGKIYAVTENSQNLITRSLGSIIKKMKEINFDTFLIETEDTGSMQNSLSILRKSEMVPIDYTYLENKDVLPAKWIRGLGGVFISYDKRLTFIDTETNLGVITKKSKFDIKQLVSFQDVTYALINKRSKNTNNFVIKVFKNSSKEQKTHKRLIQF